MGGATSRVRKFVAPEYVFGFGARNLCSQFAGNFGLRSVLVVCDPGVRSAGWVDEQLDALQDVGIRFVVFEDVSSNPRDFEVRRGAEAYRDGECEGILAIGGGSPMDCAKGIGVAATHNRDVLEFEGIDKLESPMPPLICIPTTAGSSADVSQFAIITDTVRSVKIALISKGLVPDVALIDPETTTTMPAATTAETGIDALTHAIESYVSTAASAVTDLHALAAVRAIAQNLHAACHDPDDRDARDGMMTGSMLAGIAFSNASLGLVHAMAHALGGRLDLSHGLCNALLLEHVIRFNLDAALERYETLRQILVGTRGIERDVDPTTALHKIVAAIRRSVGVKDALGDSTLVPGSIPELAALARRDTCVVTNPRNPTQQEVEELFRALL